MPQPLTFRTRYDTIAFVLAAYGLAVGFTVFWPSCPAPKRIILIGCACASLPRSDTPSQLAECDNQAGTGVSLPG